MNLLRIDHQFARFALVGALNTSFTYAIYSIGIYAGLNHRLANFFGLSLGLFFGFVTQGQLVFRRLDRRRLPRFLVMWICLWVLNAVLIDLFLPSVDQNKYLAGALALIPIVLLSFLGQKYFVFSENRG